MSAEMSAEEREVRRRMAQQELYKDYGQGLEDLEEVRVRARELSAQFNSSSPRDTEGRSRLLAEMLGTAGAGAWIEPPFHVSYGKHTHIGERFYANFGLTLIDDSEVIIGDEVMIGPHVTISTAGHPIHPDVRSTDYQFSAPVKLEDRAWIGANVTILPGVTIGYGSVVAAGAVVTGNVPPMTVVGGIPARVIRSITEDDKLWQYKAPQTLGLPL